MFEGLPDAQAAKGPGIYLDLSRGTCKDARFVRPHRPVSPEFVFRATGELATDPATRAGPRQGDPWRHDQNVREPGEDHAVRDCRRGTDRTCRGCF